MSEDDKIPQIVLLPQVQEQLDGDPELAKAVKGLSESLLNAMQGFKDGRYKSFDDAVEAMTGERPTVVEPPKPPKHGYYLSVGPNPRGDDWMAVITDGHPSKGHTPIEVMDVECFKTAEEAMPWFEIRCRVLPYETADEQEPPNEPEPQQS